MRLSLLALVCLLVTAGCGGAPKRTFETYWKIGQIGALRFGVEEEPTPPGFSPTPLEPSERKSRSTPYEGGVATIYLVDEDDTVIAKVEHVDATAQIYRWGDHVYLAHVGPNGERYSRVYLYRRSSSLGLEYQPASFTPVGKPTHRVTRYKGTWGREDNKPLVFAGPKGDPDLIVPIDHEGNVAVIPQGVVATAIVSRSPDSDEWGGLLVRWKGVAGEGWSLARDPMLKDIGTGPRWVRAFTQGSYDAGLVMLGEAPDGTCEAVPVAPKDRDFDRSFEEATCEAAFTRIESAILVSAHVKAYGNAMRAQAKYDEEKKRRDAEDAQARARQAKAETASKLAAEEQSATAKYKELVKVRQYTQACTEAERLRPATHSALVASRVAEPDYNSAELTCLKVRDPSGRLAALVTKALWDHDNRKGSWYGENQSGPVATPAPVGPGPAWQPGPGPSLPAGPSHEERMRQMNNYTYGSGKASSCPFTDKSYCR